MDGLIWEESLWSFLFVTVVLGGGTAWMTGRAVALGWDARWKLFIYVLLLACAVRFIHFALFDGTLLSLHFFIIDLAVLLAVAALAHLFTRSAQMSAQYRFAYERSGPFKWKVRP